VEFRVRRVKLFVSSRDVVSRKCRSSHRRDIGWFSRCSYQRSRINPRDPMCALVVPRVVEQAGLFDRVPVVARPIIMKFLAN